ncbi:MAG: hypothetical protein PHV30_10905 [Candidatus Margulisbacteria bacterium]|nr:hypothetical protein [Candidatus Margulisiibacteriota bacterium]
MAEFNLKQLLAFIEESPEKSIPKSILIKEINNIRETFKHHVELAVKWIKYSFLAGVFYNLGVVAYIIYNFFENQESMLPKLYIMDIFVSIIFLAGLQKKSRLCAFILLMYFILSNLIHINYQGLNIANILLSMILILFYILGIIGTFIYHKYKDYI